MSPLKGKNRTLKKILKRDGSIERFSTKKIASALTKVGKISGEFDEKVAKQLTVKVIYLAQNLEFDNIPTADDIAQVVEEVLMNTYKSSAKSFILYRDQQERFHSFTINKQIDLVNRYVKKDDWKVRENSNMGYSLQGLHNYISSEISQNFWLRSIYPKPIRDAHLDGQMHIHDLSSISTYCCGWDLQQLLTEGFCGVENKTESKPPKHFRTALGQLVNFFYTLQGESAGAQAFSSFDTLLAPYIYYDKLTYKEVRQAIQECIFNLNVPTRVGFQMPFTNLTFDLLPSSNYADQAVVIAGETKDKKYGDFQKEMDMINKAFCEVMLEGDAKGRVFSFPIPTYNITNEFDWDNKNLDLLWEMTAKYGIPYFANYMNSDMSPDDARSMCCRLRIDNRVLLKRGGGLFGANPLTGSVGVVTINLPRLGYESKDEKEFFSKLEHLMILAKDSLEIKRVMIEQFTDDGLYPYTTFYLRHIKERFTKYWTNHFSTIGIIGLNEACLNLLAEDIGSKIGLAFATKVLNFMRDKMLGFQEETNNNYNLEATPAEATTLSLALKDKKKYPKIIVANEEAYRSGAAPFYTNSSNLPVNYTEDIFAALDHQDNLQPLYTGGTVQHLFLGEAVEDVTVLKSLVRKVCTQYHIPYISITPTFSICPIHGYLAGAQEFCPKCDSVLLAEAEQKEKDDR